MPRLRGCRNLKLGSDNYGTSKNSTLKSQKINFDRAKHTNLCIKRNQTLNVLTISFRVNTDWLWDNFPNERRFASMIFIADNILVPEVIQAIYKVHKSVDEGVTPGEIRYAVVYII